MNKGCKTSIPLVAVVGLGTGVPVALFIASGGPAQFSTAIISGVVVGGASALIYGLYSCHFNLVECTGSGIAGTLKRAACIF